MPPNLIVYAILGFSLGVEAGNQLVLLPLYGIVRSIRGAHGVRTVPQYRPIRLLQLASGLVAVAGLYYLVADLLVA